MLRLLLLLLELLLLQLPYCKWLTIGKTRRLPLMSSGQLSYKSPRLSGHCPALHAASQGCDRAQL